MRHLQRLEDCRAQDDLWQPARQAPERGQLGRHACPEGLPSALACAPAPLRAQNRPSVSILDHVRCAKLLVQGLRGRYPCLSLAEARRYHTWASNTTSCQVKKASLLSSCALGACILGGQTCARPLKKNPYSKIRWTSFHGSSAAISEIWLDTSLNWEISCFWRSFSDRARWMSVRYLQPAASPVMAQ